MKKENLVLVVDNDPQILTVMANILADKGMEVLKAANGEEALKILNREIGEDVVAVVTDIMMPFMNGIELGKQIIGRLPVIMVTGADDRLFVKRTVDICDAYVDKLDIKEKLYLATIKAIERHDPDIGLEAA